MVDGRSRFLDGYAARLMWIVAECHRDTEKQRRPYELKEFMPKRKRRRRKPPRNDAAIDAFLGRYRKQDRKS